MSGISSVARLPSCVEGGILGESPALGHAVDLAARFARTSLSVLLQGATGTGKELFAHMIHEQSGRPGRFVPVNCGALPRTMIESLLFGHRRGAFTDAHESAPGFVEAASHGTLYLDELASLPLQDQVKLLRVLESQEVYRVGETEPRRVDLRVVSSVQDRPAKLVASGTLRLDFCERIAGVVVALPALCERGNDVWVLAEQFARQQRKRLGQGVSEALGQYGWPGNVRQLRAVIERAAALADGDVIEARLIPDAIALGAAEDVRATETAPRDGTAERFEERSHLIAACKANGWHAGRTATALGIARVTLYRRLKAAGLLLRAEKRIHRVRAVNATDPV